MKKSKITPTSPWEEFPKIWKTEAAFWGWIRGGLRKGLWMRHPVKISYLQQHREKKPIGKKTQKNPKGLVFTLDCEICEESFRQNEVEVDHITPAGSLKTLQDLAAFVERLSFVGWDDLRVLCKPCHKTVSLAERMGMTFEEAKLHKRVIEFTKLPTVTQKTFLEKRGMSEDDISNATKRKEVVRGMLARGELD